MYLSSRTIWTRYRFLSWYSSKITHLHIYLLEIHFNNIFSPKPRRRKVAMTINVIHHFIPFSETVNAGGVLLILSAKKRMYREGTLQTGT
jgi:hypothetical protein